MSLVRSSLFFTAGTFLSRISGLIRDMVLTGVFGSSSAMESFLIANRIPNLFRDMLAEGALGSSFTKIYTSLSIEDEERAHQLLCDAFRFGFFLLLFISLVGSLGSSWLVQLFTLFSDQSGRPSQFVGETTLLTRLIFPFLGFAILAALAGGVLQKQGKFFLASVSSAGLNVGYIVGALGIVYLFPADWTDALANKSYDPRIAALAIGVVLGGALHFGIQFLSIFTRIIRLRGWIFSSSLISKDLVHVFALMAPVALASSAGTVNLLINSNFATGLGNGAVTWLNYSFRLLQLPIGIFAVAVSSVVLPSLTRAVTRAGNRMDQAASRELQNACEAIAWIMTACLVFLLINSRATVDLLYFHGAYTDFDAQETARALAAYSFGIIGYGLVKVLTSFYYAVERTTYALKVSIVTIFVNAAGNYLFAKQFGHVGLALTSSLTLTLNATLLIAGTRMNKVSWDIRGLLRSTLILAGVVVTSLLIQSFVGQSLKPPFIPGIGGAKYTAAAEIFVNATIVGIAFLGGLSIRFKQNPRSVLSFLKRARYRRGTHP